MFSRSHFIRAGLIRRLSCRRSVGRSTCRRAMRAARAALAIPSFFSRYAFVAFFPFLHLSVIGYRLIVIEKPIFTPITDMSKLAVTDIWTVNR